MGANRTSFDSMSITHGANNGKKKNIKLKHNPDPKDSRVSYIRKRIIRDYKFRFSKAFKNYKISNDDIDELIKYLQSKKKKQR